MNQLIYRYKIINKYYTEGKLGNCHQRGVGVNSHFFGNVERVIPFYGPYQIMWSRKESKQNYIKYRKITKISSELRTKGIPQ